MAKIFILEKYEAYVIVRVKNRIKAFKATFEVIKKNILRSYIRSNEYCLYIKATNVCGKNIDIFIGEEEYESMIYDCKEKIEKKEINVEDLTTITPQKCTKSELAERKIIEETDEYLQKVLKNPYSKLNDIESLRTSIKKMIRNAEEEIHLFCPWYNMNFFYFVPDIKNALERNVIIRISYGIDGGLNKLSVKRRKSTELTIKKLNNRFKGYKGIEFNLTSNHRKLVVTEKYILETSNNFASTCGDEPWKEGGTLIHTKKCFINQIQKM